MNETMKVFDDYQDECTLLLCECCFEIILEDDAEYHKDQAYCHQCIEEVKSCSRE